MIEERWEVVWCNHPWIDYPNNAEKSRRFFTEQEARLFRDSIKGKEETAWTCLVQLPTGDTNRGAP